jgi:uncharacterized membrane protein
MTRTLNLTWPAIAALVFVLIALRMAGFAGDVL